MSNVGRPPILDLEEDDAKCRAIREALRFGPRPTLRKLAQENGFKAHRSLYEVAERYEQKHGLEPTQKEEAPAATTD